MALQHETLGVGHEIAGASRFQLTREPQQCRMGVGEHVYLQSAGFEQHGRPHQGLE